MQIRFGSIQKFVGICYIENIEIEMQRKWCIFPQLTYIRAGLQVHLFLQNETQYFRKYQPAIQNGKHEYTARYNQKFVAIDLHIEGSRRSFPNSQIFIEFQKYAKYIEVVFESQNSSCAPEKGFLFFILIQF